MFLYAIIILIIVNFTCSNATLQSLHILFRHGERSPSSTYTNDPYKDYPWPGGFDQLNNRGKREMYELGRKLRKEYGQFIPEQYLAEDIHVLSSYADRCHMSAQLLLAGLYPPIGSQIWNSKLLWQPIPIHSVPRASDNKIAIKKSCPKYQRALQEVRSVDLKPVDQDNKELYDYLSNSTGDKINDILTLEFLYNILDIESLNNLTLPEWTKGVFPDKMKDISALSLAVFTKTDFMKRMHGGALLKEIIEHIRLKSNNTLKPDRKLYLYSGHDLTTVSLMRILGFDELVKPEFGATVIIEHHYINGENIIKILYKVNPFATSLPKMPSYCAEACNFNEFTAAMEKYLPIDWDEECK